MEELIKLCNIDGCCVEKTAKKLEYVLSNPPAAPPPVNVFSLVNVNMINELCGTASCLPHVFFRLVHDVYSHVKTSPRKPSWDIQTTIIMSVSQQIRDRTAMNSLSFYRMMSNTAKYLNIMSADIQLVSIPIKQRELCGVLKKMDQEETGNRLLEAEWVSAVENTPYSSNQYDKANEKIVLYLHGGGYCLMSAQTHRGLTTKISKVTGRRVIAINYRLAPEAKFPGGFYDSVQSFLYLIDKNGEYGFDPKNIMIMGDSAGGGLCLALMLYLRNHGLPLPEGSVLLSPWVDLAYSYSSWDDNALDDYLPPKPQKTTKFQPVMFYLESPNLVYNPYVSPIYADSFDHLPPILIQSGGCEVLRDEINELTAKIKGSKGTSVRHEIYEDMAHAFQAFPLAKSSEAIENIGVWAREITTGSTMAPSDATSELVAKQSSNAKGLYPHSINAKNIPSFLQTPYKYSLSSKNLQQKRKKAREATSIGGTTAIARTLMMQGLYLFYRTPIKLFRPLRVDYLVMARALMPVDDVNAKKFSFRYTSIGMISHAVKTKGWNFIPRHILPPLVANTLIGTVLYTTYIATLPIFHPPTAYQLHRPYPPPPYTSVFAAGCLAGAAQSIIATPLDSLKVRFEVNDLLEGKHRSMYQFAKSTFKELGIASAYRGFTLTLMRDSLSCGLFFATFEWVKQQGYYYFLDEMYGLHVDSSDTIMELEMGWNNMTNDEDVDTTPIRSAIERPPMILEPLFIILAGAAAAVAYQLIDHPLSKIHSIFYIEEGQSEFANKHKRESVSNLYRKTLDQCIAQAKLNGGSWRKFLYQEFGNTVLRVVPATSVGFLVFELVKREIDFKSIDFDAL
ncbi:hypothetical protein G6F28_005232 [Rhizopus arrhizus]|nr:hypothetical protein G6F28_005232 [Rhizopus arrhizus]